MMDWTRLSVNDAARELAIYGLVVRPKCVHEHKRYIEEALKAREQAAYERGKRDSVATAQWYIESYPDGMTKEDVIKELSDYQTLGNTFSEVYCHITGGAISKPFTAACHIKTVYDDLINKHYEDGYEDGYKKGKLC